jgi:hypothetical protein
MQLYKYPRSYHRGDELEQRPSDRQWPALKTLGSNSYNSLESGLEDSSIVIMIPYYIPNIILGGLANSCC